VGPLPCGGRLTGALEPGDCAEPRFGQLDIHRFELAEGSRVDIEASSAEIDSVLILLDESCVELDLNDDCVPGDTSRSCLTADLEAGTYHVGVTSFSAGELGAYEVSLSCRVGFDLCADCVAGSVSCGTPLDGTYPATSCTLAEGRPLDIYSFELAAPGPVAIELAAALRFDPILILFDAACVEVARNDDCSPATLDACIEASELGAGTYFVGVTSFEAGESGPFTLSVRCPEVAVCRDCAAGELVCGTASEGALEATDCVRENGGFADVWRLELGETSNVSVTLRSSVLETALVLLDPLCVPVASSGDCDGKGGGGGGDSCLRITQLPAGSYAVLVTTSTPAASGAYSIEAACEAFDPCRSCAAGDLACGAEALGMLAAGDCRLRDGGLYDAWRFSTERGQRLSIALSSRDFDPFLFVLDSACATIASARCEGGACIEIDVAPGEHFLAAGSTGAANGAYELTLDCGDIPTCRDCAVGEIACNSPLAGSLSTSGCRLADGSAIDFHELTLTAAAEVSITLESASFDTFLFLFDESCVPLAANDDCPGGDSTDSCLELPLAAGTYFVAVNSLAAGESGSYALEASLSAGCGPPSARLPGDLDGNLVLDAADGSLLLEHLYGEAGAPLPCGSGSAAHASNAALIDWNGDSHADVSDPVVLFSFLFRGGPAHTLGEECLELEGCPEACLP
jgi:hypothetical protein